jgi:hypothetical protein
MWRWKVPLISKGQLEDAFYGHSERGAKEAGKNPNGNEGISVLIIQSGV